MQKIDIKKLLKKLVYYFKEAWIVFGIVVIIFFLVNIFLFIPKYILKKNLFCNYSYFFKNSSDKGKYCKEIKESSSFEYSPYELYKRVDFNGELINIVNNYRVTKNFDCNKPVRIFFFGGSTMWGSGQRDDYTIPSLFSKLSYDDNICVKSYNFGESGYVTTQEYIRLFTLLRDNNIPDIVIFYDGFNDFFSSYQGYPGIHQNYLDYKYFINSKYKGNFVTNSIVRYFLYNTNVGSAFIFLLKLNNLKTYDGNADYFAKKTIDYYKFNIDAVNLLSQKYDFKAYFFWQPTALDKELNYFEKNLLKKFSFFGDKKYRLLYKKVSNLAKDINYDNYYYISDIFKDYKDENIFFDYVHITEKGNEIVTKKIYNIVKDNLISKYKEKCKC